MAHDVFISHSSKDKAIADAVCAGLEQAGIRCWIAPRDIRPGAEWAEAISEGIEGSRAFVLIFSSDSNRSNDCFREVSRAASKGIPIVSFRIGSVEPSGRMGYFLEPTHWLDAVDQPLRARIDELIDTLGLLVEKQPSRAPVEASPPADQGDTKTKARTWFSAKRLAIVVPMLCVIVAVVVVLVLVLGRADDPGLAQNGVESTTTTTVTSVLGGSWKMIESVGGPPARARHAMAYAPNADRVIMFGGSINGYNGEDGSFEDTWAYDASVKTWIDLDTAGQAPSGRFDFSMVYDPSSGKLVLFGGSDYQADGLYNDIWVFDPLAGAWASFPISGASPPARFGYAMVHDAKTGLFLLFGGEGYGEAYDDTWALDLESKRWTRLYPSGNLPSGRVHHSMVYDSERGKVVMFGGDSGMFSREAPQPFDDTWEYDPDANTWTELQPTGDVPSARGGQTMVYDPASGKIVLFGGGSDIGSYFSDTYVYDAVDNSWERSAETSNEPEARWYHRMTYDAVSEEFILFGGLGDGGVYSGTWSYVMEE